MIFSRTKWLGNAGYSQADRALAEGWRLQTAGPDGLLMGLLPMELLKGQWVDHDPLSTACGLAKAARPQLWLGTDRSRNDPREGVAVSALPALHPDEQTCVNEQRNVAEGALFHLTVTYRFSAEQGHLLVASVALFRCSDR